MVFNIETSLSELFILFFKWPNFVHQMLNLLPGRLYWNASKYKASAASLQPILNWCPSSAHCYFQITVDRLILFLLLVNLDFTLHQSTLEQLCNDFCDSGGAFSNLRKIQPEEISQKMWMCLKRCWHLSTKKNITKIRLKSIYLSICNLINTRLSQDTLASDSFSSVCSAPIQNVRNTKLLVYTLKFQSREVFFWVCCLPLE